MIAFLPRLTKEYLWWNDLFNSQGGHRWNDRMALAQFVIQAGNSNFQCGYVRAAKNVGTI